MALDAESIDALTFDCYGTLVDWASGIPTALRPILQNHDTEIDHDRLFSLYSRFERDIESGEYVNYREVLRRVVRRFGSHFDFTPTNAEVERFAGSVGDWPLFADTNETLRRLDDSFRLAVISNVDDDLFQNTARHLAVEFDEVVTSEQVRTYKPELEPFETAFIRLGVPPNRVLHIAQSVYHDVNPASRLGLSCVWVQRYDTRFDPPVPTSEPIRTVPGLASLAGGLCSEEV